MLQGHSPTPVLQQAKRVAQHVKQVAQHAKQERRRQQHTGNRSERGQAHRMKWEVAEICAGGEVVGAAGQWGFRVCAYFTNQRTQPPIHPPTHTPQTKAC